jgi:hypothetical protein
MGAINEQKSLRAQQIARAWKAVHYQTEPTNCGNCDFANGKWVGSKGECNLVSLLPFPVFKFGICRQHSRFRVKPND